MAIRAETLERMGRALSAWGVKDNDLCLVLNFDTKVRDLAKEIKTPSVPVPIEAVNLPNPNSKLYCNLLREGGLLTLEDVLTAKQETILAIPGVDWAVARTVWILLQACGYFADWDLPTPDSVYPEEDKLAGLDLSTSTYFRLANILGMRHSPRISQLCQMTETEVSKVPGIGPKRLTEIKARLHERDLSLKAD